MKFTGTEFNTAFFFATRRAAAEISIAVITVFTVFLAKVIGMQPVPVPMSKIASGVF